MRLVILLLAPALLLADDPDFDALVRSMESHYGSKKVHIPMLGFANFLVKVARPAGTKDFKLAVFEDVDSDRHPTAERLDDALLPQGWKPFARVTSNRKGERVHIYSRQSHRDHELMIATLERREAVIVRVRLNAERLARWVNNPVVMARRSKMMNAD
jgi:hypothetical protein